MLTQPISQSHLQTIHHTIQKVVSDVLHHFGPGLIKDVFEICLAHEMNSAGYTLERNAIVPVRVHHLVLNEGFRVDFLIERSVILKVMTGNGPRDQFRHQLSKQLLLTGCCVGFLVDFGAVSVLPDRVSRIEPMIVPEEEITNTFSKNVGKMIKY